MQRFGKELQPKEQSDEVKKSGQKTIGAEFGFTITARVVCNRQLADPKSLHMRQDRDEAVPFAEQSYLLDHLVSVNLQPAVEIMQRYPTQQRRD